MVTMADATIHTSLGDVSFDFFDHCPDAVGNFVDLAEDGLYDGSQFDDRIRDFIIQGGDVVDDVDQYFLDEYSESVQFDRPYLVACAGRGNFSHPSIFFITLAPAEHLNSRCTIFGEVTDEASKAVLADINDADKAAVVTIDHIEIQEQS